MKKRLQQVAKNYADVKEFFVTEDGQVFINEDNAAAHAKEMGGSYKIYNHAQIENLPDDEEAEAKAKAEAEAETKAEAKKTKKK